VWILYNDIILAKESKYVKLLNTTSSRENIIMSISNMLSNVKIENVFDDVMYTTYDPCLYYNDLS
jgi:hypothetical protein